MKLKYYMRGLGIGIVLTTLILMIANPKEKMTDQEIKERALALGMQEAGEQEDKSLSEVLDQIKATLAPTNGPTEPSAIPTPTLSPEPTSAPEPTDKPTVTPKPTPTPEINQPDDPGNTGNDGVNEGELVTFTVEPGMSSGKVAALLVKMGLIKDADDFNQYIVKEKKASVIRVGTYTLPKGAGYEEIVTKITTKQ